MKTAPEYISYQGYAALYGSESNHCWDDALEMLQGSEMSLAIPGSPRLVLVLDELCEKRRDVTEKNFRDTLRSAPSLWFKVWGPNESDLLCNFQRGNGWWCEYYVIGYLQSEAEILVKNLIHRFVSGCHVDREHLLVVDWENRAADVDWDEFWGGGSAYSGEALDVLGVPKRLASQLVGSVQGGVETDLPGHRMVIKR